MYRPDNMFFRSRSSLEDMPYIDLDSIPNRGLVGLSARVRRHRIAVPTYTHDFITVTTTLVQGQQWL
jgi:hypothetical protein